MFILENEKIILGLDENSGSLVRLYSKTAGRELIQPQKAHVSPFGIYRGFEKPFVFSDFAKPIDPETLCTEFLTPENPVFADSEKGASVTYSLGRGLSAQLGIELADDCARLSLKLTNCGDCEVSLIPDFPRLDGVCLPDDGRMLGVNQAGAVDRIWAYPGGVYGNAADQSAQLGCLFHENTCLGFYIEDPEFVGKYIRYSRPAVSVIWFPEKILRPGESLTLPTAVITAYAGSWHETPRKYSAWFRKSFDLPEIPDSIRSNDSYRGMWFEKKGKPNSPVAPLGQPLDRFEELSVHFDEYGVDILEYAFFSQLSAQEKPLDFINCCGSTRRHTDGLNVVRSDLGGKEALRRGVELAHEKGKKVMLYVEGLIVPRESDLFKVIPQAENWKYMNPDGSNDGPYTYDGFVHMCCGSEEWQDHLANTCARLVADTGVDGIRLDSFAFYHWPCYDPAHHHHSPFDCNKWMIRLLKKVRSAVTAVKPDAILATESACDFYRLFFNTALDQYFDPSRIAYGTEDCSVFRVMFPEYYIPRINGGPVFESLLLMAEGCRNPYAPKEELRLFDNWKLARKFLGTVFTHGEVADIPVSSAEKALTFRTLALGDSIALLSCAPKTDLSGESPSVTLRDAKISAEVSAELPFCPSETVGFDIDAACEFTPKVTLCGNRLIWHTESRWCCLKIKK
ncbi:MAG: hypothetical protein IKZ19_06825 [Clostridia bacterium]|nr:hypothetical protein [Clostridia bacterium]